MFKKFIFLFLLCIGIVNVSYSQETVTELLDEAQVSLKKAFEMKGYIKAPYEYAKALTYYNIAKEETSKLHIELGKEAALKSIKWALRAIEKGYEGGVK